MSLNHPCTSDLSIQLGQYSSETETNGGQGRYGALSKWAVAYLCSHTPAPPPMPNSSKHVPTPSVSGGNFTNDEDGTVSTNFWHSALQESPAERNIFYNRSFARTSTVHPKCPAGTTNGFSSSPRLSPCRPNGVHQMVYTDNLYTLQTARIEVRMTMKLVTSS